MDAKLYFGKVHIVEWLRPGDRRTGAELLDELEPLGIVSKPPVLAQLHRVSTRADFLGVLRGIESEFRATARLPVLHIEAHGDYDGIGLSDAEGFTFHELMEELIPLNTLTGLRLIVVMSACLGMWAVSTGSAASTSCSICSPRTTDASPSHLRNVSRKIARSRARIARDGHRRRAGSCQRFHRASLRSSESGPSAAVL